MCIRDSTETVQEIRHDADLSRRVGLYKEDGRKNRDEIAYLAQTFDEMLEELEKVFQREKQFTSDVSHELRTPVSVILAQCESCLEEESFNEKQREQIMVIQKKARTIAELISHLLMLSRADQGRLKLHLEEVNVSEPVSYTHLDVYKRQLFRWVYLGGSLSDLVLRCSITVSTKSHFRMHCHFLEVPDLFRLSLQLYICLLELVCILCGRRFRMASMRLEDWLQEADMREL